MLLRNESKVKHSILIKLVFDDNLTRELEIQEDDYIQVSYRKNGCLKCGVGVIKKIKHYNLAFKRKDSAIITLDMSTNLECNIDSFDIQDIIDVRKIIPIDCNCCCCGNETSDTKLSTPIPDCGYPVTYKGVKISD